MTVIHTNAPSLIAQQALAASSRQIGHAMTELSTGRRIHCAADDAAGLAIGNKLGTQVISLGQAIRNAGDGVSMMQTADGAAGEISAMLMRMRELAVQSVNDTHSASGRTALNQEFGELRSQIRQVTDHTQWNGMKVVGGDKATVAFQVGASGDDKVRVMLRDLWASGIASMVSVAHVLSAGAAGEAIDDIDRAIAAIDDFRSTLGAGMNQLVHASDNAMNVMTRTAASRGRVVDADYARATSELARAQIVQQAATAMLSQANQMPRLVELLLV